MSLNAIVSLKTQLDNSSAEVVIVPPVLQHANQSTAKQLVLPEKCLWTKYHGCACFWLILRNIDCLNRSITNLTQSSASRRIAKFLLSGTMVNCRAMCESLFIQSTCILSTLFLSVFGKLAEFCFVYSVENLVKALNNFNGSFICCALSSNRSDFLDLDNLVDFTCILVQWHRQHKRDVSLALKGSVQSNDFV